MRLTALELRARATVTNSAFKINLVQPGSGEKGAEEKTQGE